MSAERLAHLRDLLSSPSTRSPRRGAAQLPAGPRRLHARGPLPRRGGRSSPRLRAGRSRRLRPVRGAPATPHDREQELVTARKVGAVRAYGRAAFGTGARALGAAAFVARLRVAGGRPRLRRRRSRSQRYALLPGSRSRSSSPSPPPCHAGAHPGGGAGRLLPSSLGALLPVGARGPLPDLLDAVDLFSLWVARPLRRGDVGVARVSLRRAAVAAALLWLAYVGVVKVALPSLARGGVP